MWNSVLRYISQTYLNQAIVCMLELTKFGDLDLGSKIISPLTLVYLALIPILFYFILKRNRENLHKPEIKLSIGSLYMNYETDKDSVLHYTLCFLYRRFVFAFTIAFLKIDLVLQIFVTYNGCLLLLIYLLLWQPMESNFFDFLCIFNEFILCFCCYMMILYTDYVPKPEMRYEFGKMFLVILYIDLALNIFLLAIEIAR